MNGGITTDILLQKGQKLSLVIYNGESSEEAKDLYEAVEKARTTKELVPLRHTDFSICIECVQATSQFSFVRDCRIYRIALEGELV